MARACRRKRLHGHLPGVRGRWLALAALAFVAFLYVKPLRTYLETRAAVADRSAQVEALAAQNAGLKRRLAKGATRAALVREARKLGYVRPGERLFIVTGIPTWRAQAPMRARAGSR